MAHEIIVYECFAGPWDDNVYVVFELKNGKLVSDLFGDALSDAIPVEILVV